jgi:carbon storage regulator
VIRIASFDGTSCAINRKCLTPARSAAEGVDNRSIEHHHKREISMLVLSRKLGEKIVIGDNIVVTVVKIDRNQIRLGIEAPQDVPVFREEIAPVRLSKPTTVATVAVH